MMKRRIVSIDETKCNGCGLCIPACHEGAIQLIDGKARLLEDKLCDGIGDCLGECPLGAIKIIEREADAFDEEAVAAHLQELSRKKEMEIVNKHNIPCGCPGALMKHFADMDDEVDNHEQGEIKSTLKQWPVQLSLVPVKAPYFENAELLLSADCVAFAYGNYQQLQKGRAVAVGCPKLDNGNMYVKKLAEIIKENDLKKIVIARMEVPCCGGLQSIVKEALNLSGKNVPVETKIISIQGKMLQN
ncbi:MAG: 4Fe-4S binding protein [Bacillota bacterium]